MKHAIKSMLKSDFFYILQKLQWHHLNWSVMIIQTDPCTSLLPAPAHKLILGKWLNKTKQEAIKMFSQKLSTDLCSPYISNNTKLTFKYIMYLYFTHILVNWV